MNGRISSTSRSGAVPVKGISLLILWALVSTATPQEAIRGQAGTGRALGVANVSELSSSEQPGAAARRKNKPFLSRSGNWHKPPPVNRSSAGREVSPREFERQTVTATPDNTIAEAFDAGGGFVPASGASTPAPSANFQAVLDDGFSANPDTQGAVGPNHLMATLASQIRVQDRAGNTNLTLSLSNFWASTPSQVNLDIFDPRVLYDPYGQRWIHVANANPGATNPGLLVAVSQTTDPTGSWNRYFIDVDTASDIFVDSPNVGFTKDWITVQANMYDRTNYNFFSHEIWALNKALLYAGSAQFTHFFFPGSGTNSLGGPPNAQVPVSTYDPTNAIQYLVANWDGNGGDTTNGFYGSLRVFAILGAVGSEVFIATNLVTDSPTAQFPAGTPPWDTYGLNDNNFAPQLGTTNKIYLGDARIINGAYREGILWVAHTIFLPTDHPTRASVQWWAFTPGGGVIQRGRIDDPTAAKFYAYPSIAVNRSLDVVVGYTRFSASQYPSADYAYRRDSDLPFGALRPDTVLKAGEAKYAVSVNGYNVWGDWSATVVDPDNDTDMWTLQEYASSPVSGSDRWGTWWGRISPVRDLVLTMTQSTNSVVAGSNVTYSISFTNYYLQIVSGVRLTDILPAGGVFVSATPSQGSCGATNGIVTCNFGNLAQGATGRVSIVATLLNSGTAANTATVSSFGPDATPSDNTVTINTTVTPAADLTVLMSASPDPVTVSNNLTYSVVVTNRGPSSATLVSLTNPLPANITFVSATASQGSCSSGGGIVTCSLGTIANAAVATVTIIVAPNAAGLFTNRANVVSSSFDPNLANNSTSVSSRANAAPVIGIISDRSIAEDNVLGPLSFMVSDVETPAVSLMLTGLSSNTNIVPNANIVFGGSGTNRTVTVTPAPNANGMVTITRVVTDADGAAATNSFLLTITPVNDLPTITSLANQTVNEDTATAALPFTIGDVETPAVLLTVSGASSNPTLIPNANIVFGGGGANRTVTITPATNQFGTAMITISVSDGTNSTNATFTLTVNSVNDLPTISDIVDRSVNEDTSTVPISFTVGDVETPAASLTLTASSSNPTIVPTNNIIFGGSGANRTVAVTPATNQFGIVTITVTVKDTDGGSTNDTFVLTVNAVNDPPTINPISEVVTNEDPGTVVVNLSGIGPGATNESQSLTVIASSSNPGLIPTPAVSYTSPNPTGTLSFAPTLNSNGTAVITVTVNDNALSNNITTLTFNVIITPVNDPPTISDITDRTINEDSSTNISFTIGDVESPATSLTLSGSSSNTNIVPNANITFTGSGSNRTATVTPAPNANGSCVITVIVSDGQTNSSASFVLNVLPINDPPTISSIADRSINEDTSTNISFTVADVDTPLGNLTIAATSSSQAIVPNLNLSITGAGANRTLTILPATNQSGVVTIMLTVNDGSGGSNSTSFVLTVVAVNDPPTLDPIANITIGEDFPQQTVNLTGIGTGAPNEMQTLIVTASSSNPGLIPTPLVTYTSANPTGTLRFAPAAESNGVAIIRVTVDDGGGLNSTFSRDFTVTVTNVNDPPAISTIPDLTINEDTVTNIAFTIGDIDNAASSLTLQALSSNEELIVPGDITFSGTGANRIVTLRPLTNQFGSATITIIVSDPDGASTNDTFELTVVAVNDPPSISSFSNITINEDTASGLIGFTVSDPETLPGDLRVTALSSNQTLVPTNNLIVGGSGSSRTLRILPATNQFGTSLITVVVNDGVLASSNSFLLTVNSINDFPIISSVADRAVDEDTSTGPIAFTIGDVETPAGSLALIVTSSAPSVVPTNNIIFGGSGSNRTITVLPATDRFGISTITTTVIDTDGGSASNSFVLTVNAVNDPPILDAIANTNIEANTGSRTINLSGIGPGGFGEVQALSVTASSSNPGLIPAPVVNYTSPNPAGTLTLTPAANLTGTATITVTVTDDAATNNVFSRTFSVTVFTFNHPPTLNPLTNITIFEDAPQQNINLTGIGTGSLNETQTLTITASSSNPGLIPTPSVSYTNPSTTGVLRFTPNGNSNGTAMITVTVNDGGASNNFFSQMFTVTVTAVNDRPTISAITDQTTAEDTAITIGFIVADVDNPVAALTVSGSSTNTSLVNSGSFSFSGTDTNRIVTIRPVTNAFGSTLITLVVNDGSGGTASNRFVLTVNPVADPPSISDIPDTTMAEDSQLTLNFTVGDLEGSAAALQLTAISSNAGLLPSSAIQFGGSGSNRTVTVTPLLNQTGTVTVRLIVASGTGLSSSDSFLLTVTNVNDPPTISGLPALTINEDTATGPLSFTVGDIETAPASLTLTGASSNQGLVPNGNITFGGAGADRTVTITPVANQSGAATITLTVNDGSGGSTNTSFVLNVVAVNDPPTINPISNIVTNEDAGPITVSLNGISAGGSENQTLTVTASSSNPSLVSVTTVSYTSPNPTGALTLTPVTNATGTATITVTVNGGAGSNNIATATFTVTLNPVNDPPTISAIANQQTNEDAPLTVGFTIGDAETPALSLALLGASTNTTLVPNGNIFFSGSGSNRTVTILPATNQFGTTLIAIGVSDGMATNTATFVLTVNPVNDPPTLDVIPTLVTNSANNGVYTVAFTGVSSGANNESQTLMVTASSSNTGLLPTPTVAYSSPSTNGTLTLRPANGASGVSTVTVTVTDGGTTNNTFSRTFLVNIKSSGNVVPTISAIANQTTPEDTTLGPIPFTVRDSVTPASSLTLMACSSDMGLLPTNNIVFGGSGTNRTLTLIPAANRSGIATVFLTVLDTSFGSSNLTFTLTVTPVNDAPTISGIANQTVLEDTVIGPLAFNVTDVETPPGNLIVTAISGNQTLVPNANIVLGGSGTNRALLITPATNQSGTATITLSVSDGAGSNSTIFTVTVNATNDPPTISDIADQTINEDSATPIIAFTVGDVETPAGTLTLSGDSSNPTLIPINNIIFGGSGASRTVAVTPATNLSGTSTITITVSDGTATVSDTFLLTVNPVNDPPTLNAIGNVVINQNVPQQTVNLTGIGTGAPNETQTLIVTASSSNPALIPNPTVNYTNPNATGTLTFTPIANASGTTTITVTVNDGQPQNNIMTRTFTLMVNAAPTISGLTNVVLNEDSFSGAIPFTIADAETPAANLTVSAASSNLGLVPNANLFTAGNGTNRTLTITPLTNQFGFSTITVSVSDSNGNVSSNSFLLTVVPVNDAPTLNLITNVTVLQNSGPQTVNLTGIGSGAANENQTLTVQAISGYYTVIPDPIVSYTSPNSTATLTFTPVSNATRVVLITVKVTDDGGTAHGGSNSITRTFLITVLSVTNTPPALQIVRSGASAIISWQTNSGSGWSLQCNTNISNSGGWGPVVTLPVIVNGRYTVTNSLTGNAKYYRLTSGVPSVPPPPALTISRSGSEVVLAWPVAAGSFILEHRSNLEGNVSIGWLPVSKPVVVLKNQNTVTLDASVGNDFYRLRVE